MTFLAYGQPNAWVASFPDMGALLPISLYWVEAGFLSLCFGMGVAMRTMVTWDMYTVFIKCVMIAIN